MVLVYDSRRLVSTGHWPDHVRLIQAICVAAPPPL